MEETTLPVQIDPYSQIEPVNYFYFIFYITFVCLFFKDIVNKTQTLINDDDDKTPLTNQSKKSAQKRT